MSCIFEDSKRRYYRDGRIEAIAESVKSIMTQLNKTLEESFEILGVNETDRPWVIDRLKEDGIF